MPIAGCSNRTRVADSCCIVTRRNSRSTNPFRHRRHLQHPCAVQRFRNSISLQGIAAKPIDVLGQAIQGRTFLAQLAGDPVSCRGMNRYQWARACRSCPSLLAIWAVVPPRCRHHSLRRPSRIPRRAGPTSDAAGLRRESELRRADGTPFRPA